MADKTYVDVGPTSVKAAFDNKYKASLPKLMRAAVVKAIDRSGKLTTKKPSGGDAEGFYVDGSISVDKSEKGKAVMLSADAKFLLATWPKKSMFAFPSGSAETEAEKPDKPDGDVEYLVTEVINSIMKDVVKLLESRAG